MKLPRRNSSEWQAWNGRHEWEKKKAARERRNKRQRTRKCISRKLQVRWNRIRRKKAHAKAAERREARLRMTPDDRARHKFDLRLRRSHGITLAQYEALAEHQVWKCAVCGTPAPTNRYCARRGRYQGRLVLDHHPETDLIRGLLCDRCLRTAQRFSTTLPLFPASARSPVLPSEEPVSPSLAVYLESPPAGAEWAPDSWDHRTGQILSNAQILRTDPRTP